MMAAEGHFKRRFHLLKTARLVQGPAFKLDQPPTPWLETRIQEQNAQEQNAGSDVSYYDEDEGRPSKKIKSGVICIA
jgi:hypothetical protein